MIIDMYMAITLRVVNWKKIISWAAVHQRQDSDYNWLEGRASIIFLPCPSHLPGEFKTHGF